LDERIRVAEIYRLLHRENHVERRFERQLTHSLAARVSQR
jgi:hypothetical protein